MNIRIGQRQKIGSLLVIFLLGAPVCSSQSNRSSEGKALPQSSPSSQSFDELVQRAQTAIDGGQTAEATRLFERATALRPDWSEGWWYLGTIFYDAGNYREARSAFEHFVVVEHREPGPGFGMLGLSEFRLNQYQRALDALERGRELGLGTNSEFAQTVLYHDGILNTFYGKPEFALQRFTLIANRIASAHPDTPQAAVFADPELIDAFGLAALRIPRLLPSQIPAASAALIRSAGHAQALIAMQDRVAAGNELRKLVSLYPSEPGIHYLYGVFLLKEDPPSAVGEFRREIQVSPANAAPRIQLAFEFLRVADYQQGLKFAREAVALAPSDFAAHVVCGRLWLALGHADQSLPELRTAVKLAPGSPDAHFALSRALAQAGLARQAEHERAEFERLRAQANAADR